MRADIHVGIFDVFIFLGVFQGLLLSWFFIKNGQDNRKANLYQGLILFSMSLIIFEEWLNNTGFIVRILALSNISESFGFAIGPLFYLYITSILNPEKRTRPWLHLIPFLFWSFYMVFYFIQPDEIKYNSYIETKHIDWGYIQATMTFPEDPIGLRNIINYLIILQIGIYFVCAIIVQWRKARSLNESLFRTKNELLVIPRNFTIHLLIIFLLFLATKIYFGMGSEIGGYFVASYISFMIYATSYQVLDKSDYFEKSVSFLPFPLIKYQKSSLSDENKEIILSKIRKEMEQNNYFTNNLASLTGLSKQINESSHHVSQVINEKLNKNFFELLAFYRVGYAKKLIREDKEIKLTVEELAERVGYNSKSSFNIAFKKYTSKTPSEYRKSLNDQ